VGVILQDLADYFPLHTQGTIVGLSHGEDGHLLTYELAVGTGPQQRQVIELGFGVLLGELARHVRGWVPPLVFMRHGPPANRTWHRRLFGEHVIYNADRNGMLVETAVLARPTVAGNRAVHDPLVAQFGAAARTATGIEALRTEALVRAMLPFAPVNLAICARMLRLSRRTLQRQLETQGTSFNAILDQVRAGLALSYLVESSLTAAQVAEILQFSETSALSRAVRRWYGICPRAVRSQARQPG